MSFFQKRVRDLKFLYIITSSASALPIFAGVPFIICLLFYFIIEWLHYAANRAERVFFAKDGANLGEPLFAKTGMADFRGCFEYSPRPIFDLCPKMRGSCFHLFRHFLAHFLGDLLYFIESGFLWAPLPPLSIFAYNIYQTGLKNRCILIKVVLHEMRLIYKQY